MKNFSLNRVKAIRRIRAGTSAEHVCNAMGLQIDSVSKLEAACRGVPDDILANIELILIDYEKMRRLVADLVPTRSLD